MPFVEEGRVEATMLMSTSAGLGHDGRHLRSSHEASTFAKPRSGRASLSVCLAACFDMSSCVCTGELRDSEQSKTNIRMKAGHVSLAGKRRALPNLDSMLKPDCSCSG